MSDVTYLSVRVADAKRTSLPLYGTTRGGYSVRRGAPTSIKVRLDGERRWRRLMVWQFSNSGTAFVRIKGEPHVIPGHAVQDVYSLL